MQLMIMEVFFFFFFFFLSELRKNGVRGWGWAWGRVAGRMQMKTEYSGKVVCSSLWYNVGYGFVIFVPQQMVCYKIEKTIF